MATRVQLIPHTVYRPLTTGITFPEPFTKHPLSKFRRKGEDHKWAIRLSLEDEQSPPKAMVDVERMVEFLFDDQAIDRTAYDEHLMFRDPITKYDTLTGYLFNIAMLKLLFEPDCQLHWAKQTGPYEISTRWTVVMRCNLFPWRPELVFTGTSIMGINPKTGKFCSHVDYWDSIKANDYFSVEGFWDMFRQLHTYKTPTTLETPKYQILKRAADYEVRRYAPFTVAETQGDKFSVSTSFNAIVDYIFGKNSKTEKIPMTTPVFTDQANNAEESNVAIQIVLPQDKDLRSLSESFRLRKVEGGIAATLKFSGKPTEDVVKEKGKQLRDSLAKDGLTPRKGCVLAIYNDPDRTWDFIMRNEVLIWLEDFRWIRNVEHPD